VSAEARVENGTIVTSSDGADAGGEVGDAAGPPSSA
jgi:hypothetical protein